MTRKRLSLIMILLLLPALIYAAAEFWVLDATDYINTQSGTYYYRFNFQTVMDLSLSYLQPTYSTSQYNHPSYISANNAIATVGVSGCDHNINYTISTGDGRFTSQSDPSKYRTFYVVASPDYSTNLGQADRSYYRYDEITSSTPSESSYLPNTKNSNTMTIRTPTTNGNNVRVNSGNAKVKAFGLDLFIIMDDLTSDDLTHLAALDDYIATITISWTCNTSNCKQGHSGSFIIRVGGYYGTADDGTEDSFFLVVEPTVESLSLDIKTLLLSGNKQKIADLSIDTTTRRMSNNSTYDWRSHLFVFLSSSADYNSSGTKFLLWNIRNNSITIPYEITVTNKTNTSVKSTFDGTDGFVSTTNGNYLDLKDYSKSSSDNYYSKFTDRYQKTYYAINYDATVEIKINDKDVSVSGNNVPLSTILQNPEDYPSKYSSFVGNYQSYIYYHVVYSD